MRMLNIADAYKWGLYGIKFSALLAQTSAQYIFFLLFSSSSDLCVKGWILQLIFFLFIFKFMNINHN